MHRRVGAWRSLVAHLNGVQGVGGSNPLAPTTKSNKNGGFIGPRFIFYHQDNSAFRGSNAFREMLNFHPIRFHLYTVLFQTAKARKSPSIGVELRFPARVTRVFHESSWLQAQSAGP
jgi:hypothetical protein